jgi:hypothetical protein
MDRLEMLGDESHLFAVLAHFNLALASIIGLLPVDETSVSLFTIKIKI